ncbi:MAG: hypothetical protein E6344_18280 [Clostridium sp.]|nr:hypothetical protein [Clostridium sp.]MDU7085646.1 hypothetical protein [Clostridium sp.]
MNSIIYMIFNILLIVNVILAIGIIKSNKERNEKVKELIEIDKKLRGDLANHRMEHRFKAGETEMLTRKLNAVNRKLTILNKANYKKY